MQNLWFSSVARGVKNETHIIAECIIEVIPKDDGIRQRSETGAYLRLESRQFTFFKVNATIRRCIAPTKHTNLKPPP